MTRRRVPPRDSAPTLDSDVRPAQLGIPGTEPKLTPDPQIDRIRDILFGPQMQTYEQQFAALREEVAGLRQEIAALSTRLGEQSEEQARSLESARRGLRVSIDHLRADVDRMAERLSVEKVDRAALGELFASLGARLKEDGSR